jgi:hypothetical protein
MSKFDATVGEVHGPSDPMSMSFTRSQMGDMYVGEAEIEAPRYYISIFTVSKREHIVQQPPLIPYLIVPACSADEDYKLVVKIPHPMLQIERHPDKNEAQIFRHQAERVAQSICNPNNSSLDQDAQIRIPTGLGVDLNAQGVFWSKNEVPTKDELQKAHARVDKYYMQLIERARQLEIANPKELESLLNQDYHLAAEHFGLETPWHRKLVAKMDCPNCGEPLKSTKLAYHINSAGLICVIDKERSADALMGQDEKASRAGNAASPGTESPLRRGKTGA